MDGEVKVIKTCAKGRKVEECTLSTTYRFRRSPDLSTGDPVNPTHLRNRELGKAAREMEAGKPDRHILKSHLDLQSPE